MRSRYSPFLDSPCLLPTPSPVCIFPALLFSCLLPFPSIAHSFSLYFSRYCTLSSFLSTFPFSLRPSTSALSLSGHYLAFISVIPVCLHTSRLTFCVLFCFFPLFSTYIPSRSTFSFPDPILRVFTFLSSPHVLVWYHLLHFQLSSYSIPLTWGCVENGV